MYYPLPYPTHYFVYDHTQSLITINELVTDSEKR